MNRHTREMTTNAAEGLPRRRFTVAELEAMTAAGILDEDERIELIGGEIVPMSPKGDQHEMLKTALNVFWARRLPADLMFAIAKPRSGSRPTPTWSPTSSSIRRRAASRGLPPRPRSLWSRSRISSLGYDLGRKAALYASFGIAELWVIDAVKLITHIHRAPGATGYGSVVVVAKDHPLVPQAEPALAVTLGDLDLH